MNRRAAARIEAAVDAGAALLFAAAVAYALWRLMTTQVAAAGSIGAFALCLAGLRRVPATHVSPVESCCGPTPVADLLAEADRSIAHAEDELVLDDILAALDSGSRVVRLFEPAAMPTPGQLKDRIDRHLGAGGVTPASDASQALHDALADLRRSLR
jgi:hypothetical protein